MIQLVDAKDRLVRLGKFNNQIEDLCFTNTPTYWCAKCDDITQFNLNWRRSFEPENVECEFNEIMGELKEFEQEYCNFECRLCNQKVRCIYDVLEFHMSSYAYFPKKLLLHLKD